MNEIFRVLRAGKVVARFEGTDLVPAFKAAVVAAVSASGGKPVEVQKWNPASRRYETIRPQV
jgi:hypothetical protein